MTFKNALQDFFKKFPDIKKQKELAVAVSGGPDSMALLGALIEQQVPQDIYVLSVNHGLRDDAAKEIQIIADYIQAHKSKNLKHVILNWEGEKPQNAIMEAARQARYELMADYCASQNIQTLFVGHHQDDQAETFLIRLSKGSGLDGLSAMEPLHHYNEHLKIARPFLNQPKESLIKFCEAQKIPFIKDPSNKNKNYMRPRLRASANILAQEGLSAKRLSVTAKRLRRAREALETLTIQAFKQTIIEDNKDEIKFNFDDLKQYPEEIGLRVIQKALEKNRDEAPYNVRMEKLEEVFEALWFDAEAFKPRTLGGHIFALKNDVKSHQVVLSLKKEER